MNWLKATWRKFKRWLLRQPAPWQTRRVEDLPPQLECATIYLVGENDYLWFVAMLCPCGCGQTLHMNTLPDHHPNWRVTEHGDGTISLRPSVWRTVGCRSHFFLRRGFIQWCKQAIPDD